MDMVEILAPLGILLGMALLALSVWISCFLMRVFEDFRRLQDGVKKLLVYHGEEPGPRHGADAICPHCRRKMMGG